MSAGRVVLAGVDRWGYPSLAGPLLRNWARRDPSLSEVEIELVDLPFEGSARAAARALLRRRPALVGFSCFLWNVKKVLAVAAELKRLEPSVLVALGGPEVAPAAEAVLAEAKSVDFVCAGEGEETFRLLLHALLLRDRPVAEVPGLAYRHGGAVARSPAAPLIDLERADPVYADGGLPVDPTSVLLETSRGCPFLCSFCDWGPRKMRYVPLERLERELRTLVSKTKYVFLCDADILMDRARGLAILETFSRAAEGTPCTLHFESDPAFLCREAVDIIARDPFKFTMGFGLQSVNEESLENIKRRQDGRKVEENLTYLKRKAPGAQFGLSIIYGLPGEDYEGFLRTLDFALRWRPACFCANQLLMIPGADMAQDAERFGLRFQRRPPYQVYETAAMDGRQMRRARLLAFHAGTLLAFRPCVELLDGILASRPSEPGFRVRVVQEWIEAVTAQGLDLTFGMPVGEVDDHRIDERVMMAGARLREDKLLIASLLEATRSFARRFSAAPEVAA